MEAFINAFTTNNMPEVIEITQDQLQKAEKEKEILQRKINKAIEHNQSRITDQKDYLSTISGNSINDYFVSLNLPVENRPQVYLNNDHLAFRHIQDNTLVQNTIHPHALGQLSAKLGWDTGFARELSNSNDLWKRQCLAVGLTTFFHNLSGDTAYLVRTVNNQIRGFLSNSYKRLDSWAILTDFERTAHAAGCMTYDIEVSDTRHYLEVVYPQVFQAVTLNNGIVSFVIGARYRNSDFGDSSFEISTYMLNVACMNGMTRESVINRVHRGKRMDEVTFQLSDLTVQADNLAAASLARDAINYFFSPQVMEKRIHEIMSASEYMIEGRQLNNIYETLNKNGVTKPEIEAVKERLTINSPDDGLEGKLTLWKLQQALTAVSRDSGSIRKRELDEVAGNLMEKYVHIKS